MANEHQLELPAYLIPYPVESFSRPVVVTPGKTSIGREPKSIIQITHGTVSRKHAMISSDKGRYVLEDLGSQNGTYVNQKRIKQSVLKHRDKITFGQRTFLFLMRSESAKGSAATLYLPLDDTIAIQEDQIEPGEMLAQMAQSAALRFFQQTIPDPQDTAAHSIRAHERLTLLYQLSEQLRSLKSSEEVLNKGLEFILKAIQAAERAVILLMTNDNQSLEVKALIHRDSKEHNGAISISRTIVDWVLTERMALVSQNAPDDQRFKDADSIRIDYLNSVICVPIMKASKVIGILYVDSSSVVDTMTQDDAAFSAAVANELALSIDNIRLQRDALRNERMAAIGMTITNLAHNIKNLIHLNQNAADLMGMHLRKIEDADIDRNWHRIEQCFEQINNLSADMLAFAKEHEIKLKKVDINQMVSSNRDFIVESLAGKGIELELTLSPENPQCMMDEKHFQQALLNLLVNAIHAIDKKEKGRIEISTAVKNEQYLIIGVTDNGCGIDAEKKDKIFDLFYTTKGTFGSGLGLPSVQKFVERLNGKLTVKSNFGVGSTFQMIFPRIKA